MNNVFKPTDIPFISVVTKSLKVNAFEINMGLLVIVIFFLFPIKHFVSTDIKVRLRDYSWNLFEDPYINTFLCILLLCIYFTGDVKMLALILYIIHHILSHKEIIEGVDKGFFGQTRKKFN